jgi:hypothetical protein
MGTLIGTSDGSAASSPSSLSAAGHDEQPWLVNNSMTARGSACADACDATEEQMTTAA